MAGWFLAKNFSGLVYLWIFASTATQKSRLTGVLRTFGPADEKFSEQGV
jgi:hypothetical protein